MDKIMDNRLPGGVTLSFFLSSNRQPATITAMVPCSGNMICERGGTILDFPPGEEKNINHLEEMSWEALGYPQTLR